MFKLWKTLLCCAAALLTSFPAHAAYPDRPIRLMNNYPPGGALDVVARLVAERASQLLGQPVVVEYRSGASGNIGAQAAAQAAADGYTLLISTDTVFAVNPLVFPDMDAQTVNMRPLGLAGTFNMALAVRPESGIKTLAELLTHARTRSLTYASAGHASPGNLAFEKFNLAAGISPVHVPYRGNAPATTALLSGEVDVGFLAVPGMLGHVRGGKLLPLAVSGTIADPDLPAAPPIQKTGLAGLDSYDVRFGFLIMAPNNLPDEITQVWQKTLAQIYAQQDFRERLAARGIHPPFAGAEAAQTWIQTQTQTWAAVIKQANIRVN